MRNDSVGFLNITINNKNQADPIKGAKVTITEHNNRNNVIKVLKTNEAGQINFIELKAPPIDNSGVPYKKYDMIVEIPSGDRAEQGKTYVKSGIQIMNNVITNSEDDLSYIKAIENAQVDRRVFEIKIPENNIFKPEEGQIYMDPYSIPDKVIPGWNPYFVSFPPLVNPFVPTELNIYLGKVNPYQPAFKINEKKIIKENYKKYVKIVCAKEFGGIPNLTEQAAIAQVLCVNSFALNRIYTEIYINKGYKFHITNSKSFDQDYPPGGQTFDHIDKIVDQYFNKYIRIKGKVQPFLSQYCTGRTGICQNLGLPLIHCNELSKKNPHMTYNDLLRHYFRKGDFDIEIIEANEVKGIPKSFPGFTLQLGMGTDEKSLEAVKAIQTMLNIIRKNYNIIPKTQETGIFDTQTFNAVKKFQELFEKTNPEKGTVNEITWYKISEKYVAASGIAEPREILLDNCQQTNQNIEWIPVMMPVYVPVYRVSNLYKNYGE